MVRARVLTGPWLSVRLKQYRTVRNGNIKASLIAPSINVGMNGSSYPYGGDPYGYNDRPSSYYRTPAQGTAYARPSQEAGPSRQPYESPAPSYAYQPFQYPSQDTQYWEAPAYRRVRPQPVPQSAPRYDYDRSATSSYAPEPVRTQPGHDHFYGSDAGPSRHGWDSREGRAEYDGRDVGRNYRERSVGGLGQGQRSYSTQTDPPRYPSRHEDRQRAEQERVASPPPRPPNDPPADRRVTQLGGLAASSSYVPPHRRGHSAPEPQVKTEPLPPPTMAPAGPSTPVPPPRQDTSFGTPTMSSVGDTSFDTPRQSAGSADFFVTLPSAEYIALSDPKTAPPLREGRGSSTKLLVLDLNGALIFRDKKSGSRRTSYPRPYLGAFLDYLFLPEPNAKLPAYRPWEVYVWSSAQPGNVQAMVESSFGEKYIEGIWRKETDQAREKREKNGEGRLLGVWARDKLGLSSVDYRQKVQTVKDLRILSKHLLTALSLDPSDCLNHLRFDETNMVLLDDSPLKGVRQPWNEVVLPEYDGDGYQKSRLAALKGEQDEEVIPEGMDTALLCVIGILDEMRVVRNVPAWVRAGGLTPNVDASGALGRKTSAPLAIPDLTNLPSHTTFQHWHASPAVQSHWLEKGKAALARKGIELRHGIDPTVPALSRGGSPFSYSAAQSNRSLLKEMRHINGALNSSSLNDTPTRRNGKPSRRSRAYTPSAPVSTMSISPSPSPSPGPAPLPDVEEGENVSAPFRLPAGPPHSPTPARTTSKSQPNRKADSEQTWRTFRAHDVALFLSDMSERTTVPLTPEQRDLMRRTRDVLDTLGPEYDREAPALGAGEMCLDCVAREGEKEAERRTREMVQKGRENGMGRQERGPTRKEMKIARKEQTAPAAVAVANGSGGAGDVYDLRSGPVRREPQPWRSAMQNETGRDLIPTDAEIEARAPGWQYNDRNANPTPAKSQMRFKPISPKDLRANERITRYLETRSHLDVLLQAIKDAKGEADDAVIGRLESVLATLEGIRKEIKQGKKTPAVRNFLDNWEELPGRQYVAQHRAAASKALALQESQKSRKGHEAPKFGKRADVSATREGLRTAENGDRGAEVAERWSQEMATFTPAVAEAIAAVNALNPKNALKPVFFTRLIDQANCRLPSVCPAGEEGRMEASGSTSVHDKGNEAGKADDVEDQGISELDRWREKAFSHLIIPKGSRGELTISILRQICQDLQTTICQSLPSHIGKASLSSTYGSRIHLLRTDNRLLKDSNLRRKLVVHLAIYEACRLVRLRDEATTWVTSVRRGLYAMEVDMLERVEKLLAPPEPKQYPSQAVLFKKGLVRLLSGLGSGQPFVIQPVGKMGQSEWARPERRIRAPTSIWPDGDYADPSSLHPAAGADVWSGQDSEVPPPLMRAPTGDEAEVSDKEVAGLVPQQEEGYISLYDESTDHLAQKLGFDLPSSPRADVLFPWSFSGGAGSNTGSKRRISNSSSAAEGEPSSERTMREGDAGGSGRMGRERKKQKTVELDGAVLDQLVMSAGSASDTRDLQAEGSMQVGS